MVGESFLPMLVMNNLHIHVYILSNNFKVQLRTPMLATLSSTSAASAPTGFILNLFTRRLLPQPAGHGR